MPKMIDLSSFRKADACGQTVLSDTFERTKIGEKLKCDIFGDFQRSFLIIFMGFNFRLIFIWDMLWSRAKCRVPREHLATDALLKQ